MPEFTCDLKQSGTTFNHFWEHTVGSGHAPLALRADYQQQLTRAHEELGFQYVRFHGLLTGSMETLFIHEEEVVCSFFNVDRIFDFLRTIEMRPFVELGFMPEALASGEETVFNYVNHVSPPRSYSAWSDLISLLVNHSIERFGLAEVRQWYFEVWNEPNLDAFWSGDQEDYFHLYRVTAETIKGIDSEIRVGGPSTAENEWLPEFLNYCEKHNLPVDFVTTHHYPTDAFGSPEDPTITQLSQSERSILRREAQDAKRQTRGKPLFYTEWNSSSNPRDPLHDIAYTAAFATKTIMEAHGIVDGYSFWTFSDIFEENYFPSEPFHGGFGLMNLYGIPKPVYRAFQLLHELGDEQLPVDGLHNTVDCWMVRNEEDEETRVLLSNHALPLHQIDRETITMRLENCPAPDAASVARIDEQHVNPRKAWEKMGEPPYLDEAQVAQLQEAARLVWEPLDFTYADETLTATLALPPQAVAAIAVEGTGGA